MRRNNIRHFFLQKQTVIIVAVAAVAAVLMTGIYMTDKNGKNQNGKSAYVGETETEQSAEVASVIEPKQKMESTETETNQSTAEIETKPAEETETEVTETEETKVQETASVTSPAKNGQSSDRLHFSEESELLWPLNGNVIMSYHMDQTVYFATLQQYKYNPAIVIAGTLDDDVLCAADGIITDIFEDEETGCTVVMDIGDGYTATYGQLAHLVYDKGAYVSMGQALGKVAMPTKYYSVEGANLYFKLEKDGEPVDPVLFFAE